MGATNFAALGTISFEVLASPERWDNRKKYKYEKIEVIGAAPIIQWIYDDLRKIELKIKLHQLWCNPASAIAQFELLAATHTAQALVLGNETNIGNFVIEEIRSKYEWMGDNGYLVQAELELDLIESIPSAQPAGAPPPDAVALGVAAPGLTNLQVTAPGQVIEQVPSSSQPQGIPYNGGAYTSIPITTITRAGT